jgi:hypothetical protein
MDQNRTHLQDVVNRVMKCLVLYEQRFLVKLSSGVTSICSTNISRLEVIFV